MASKKKLPRSRRCKNAELVAEYCYCSLDNEKLCSEQCQKVCVDGYDAPDRADKSRHSSQASEAAAAERYLYHDSPTFEHVDHDRHRREMPPCDKHSEDKGYHKGPPFTCFDVCVGLSSIAFFYFDVVTDILLARDYYHQHSYIEFGLTAAFIIGPSLITCLLNFR
ncbi:XK-related protein 7 [Mactra antiquata]